MQPVKLSEAQSTQLASIALGHVEVEYPNHLMLVLNHPQEQISPRSLHPIFYGSYDWHSCVHGYWMLARLLNFHLEEGAITQRIRELLQRSITPEAVAGEVVYFEESGRGAFERPYGWAWLLKLAQELHESPDTVAQQAGKTLAPLEHHIVERFISYWPLQGYPIRTGTHFNSAFSTVLALEYADYACQHHVGKEQKNAEKLATVLKMQANNWYAQDENCQAWEPGGDEFLSSALTEALCMQRILPTDTFNGWLEGFLPHLHEGQPETLFIPATVSDRSDGKIAHLDGLNLSRAWCWRQLATGWKNEDPRRKIALDSADIHLDSALEHIGGNYMGAHWLASFALMALESESTP